MDTLIPILGAGVFLIVLERIIPDQKLPHVDGWWFRVVVINVLQLGVVVLAMNTWDKWFHSSEWHVFQLTGVRDELGGLLSYFAVTFFFYWWHRWRHDVNFLWLAFHQIHHSPSRIETITSFYKHPTEIIVNSLMIGAINFFLFGLSAEAGAWCLLYASLGEYFYHMNIKTPRWIGYFFQRPEMHRIHHQRGKHYKNFSDFPIWDMLFGTFENPPTYHGECGFRTERERKLKDMLFHKNVNDPFPPKDKENMLHHYLRIGLVLVGLLQFIGFATQQKWLEGIGKVTVASPLPIVFTEQKGVETFALDFTLEYEDKNGQTGKVPITPQLYARFDAPYNYRNVVGAAISYGAILPESIWKPILTFAFIEPGTIGHSFDLETPLRKVTIHLDTRTADRNETWQLTVEGPKP